MNKKKIKVVNTLEKDGLYKTYCCGVHAVIDYNFIKKGSCTRGKCSKCNKLI